MELGLSLGERASKPSFRLLEKGRDIENKRSLEICMDLSVGRNPIQSNSYQRKPENEDEKEEDEAEEEEDEDTEDDDHNQQQQKITSSSDPPLIQLDLLPNTPVPRPHQLSLLWPSSHKEVENYMGKGLDVNRHPAGEEVKSLSNSPPNSASSFQVEFGRSGNLEGERGCSRGSDEDENGSSRKKLRLSKQQSAFLEESFKEHNTLNPKQKLALAKQLNLRPRQVEVWFQNRRARTKLKQTEVDCEYLKRCCETLTEENRRLHKELQELRALKTSNPFCIQLPATTLTMCPSCERVATTSTAAAATNSGDPATSKATDLSLTTRQPFHPFSS